MDRYIFTFEDLSKAVTEMKRSVQGTASGRTLYTTELCIYLSWLGLWEDNIKEVSAEDYNKQMQVLSSEGRYLYVKEQKIADVLEKISEHISGTIIKAQSEDEFEQVKKLARENNLALDFIYKMRLFFEKYEFESKHVSEDLLKMNKMVRNLGIADTVQAEYAQYALHRAMTEKN